MKKLPILTAAAVATGVAMFVPVEAKACEDCNRDSNGFEMCESGASSGYGACWVDPIYDSCGEIIDTDCMVYYDTWCDPGSGGGWDGPMRFEDWVCFSTGWCPAE